MIIEKMVEGKKLGLVGRCLLGAGAVFSLSGCEGTLSEGDLFNVAMQGYGLRSGTVEGMQSATILGGLGKTAANRQHELNVAERGKTEVKSYIIYRNGEPVNVTPDRVVIERGEGWELVYQNGEYITVIH